MRDKIKEKRDDENLWDKNKIVTLREKFTIPKISKKLKFAKLSSPLTTPPLTCWYWFVFFRDMSKINCHEALVWCTMYDDIFKNESNSISSTNRWVAVIGDMYSVVWCWMKYYEKVSYWRSPAAFTNDFKFQVDS